MAERSHGVSEEKLEAMLVESCERSGVPRYVEDEATLRRLAVLLADRSKRQPTVMREAS